ncbi:CotH kinase family protein [Candidatus Poriferisocius sp.]|uniref:CotH kinase family protein n=1 Tax=Candidatus Poriferisocius sp. TaxID=3101276 RepID=UPI003B5BADE7
MLRRVVVVLVAGVVVLAGCGGGGDGSGDSGTPVATGTPSGAVPDTAEAAGDSRDGQAAGAASDSEDEEAAGAAEDAGGRQEEDPRAGYFALDRVLDISIEIAPEDWDTLRHQTRTLEDVFAEIQEYNLSRPFADIYTWFHATVTVDGETHTDVGVRKKGFVGSQSDTKPALKLRFDKYVDDQSLGGVMQRMTLNNSVQDPSMINTCLSYRVFAAAGNPAPRCNFATVSVNGKNLGLFVHVEEIKAPFLLRFFDSAEGNLYEGTVSDFTPTYRGTIERKTNEGDPDWGDIDAVVAALADESDRGLEALGEIVDLDRFLSFWATEVLVGHWDGYAGNRNNHHFYREPDGPFVFIPWGTDGTFHLEDDPNPFDGIDNPPPSVLALTAIPNRLYNHPDWRDKYVARLRELLDTVWDEEELLTVVDDMAAVVQEHSLEDARADAAEDTERVRKFIYQRRGDILADLTPEPPEWPGSVVDVTPSLGSGTVDVAFETTWGSNGNPNPLEEGAVLRAVLNGEEQAVAGIGVVAGPAGAEEQALLPGRERLASIAVLTVDEDGTVSGMTLVLDEDRLVAGATLVIGRDAFAGGAWSIPPGSPSPDAFSPFTEGTLELSAAGTTSGAAIAGTFSGVFGSEGPPGDGDDPAAGQEPGAGQGSSSAQPDLVINEVAAKGDPLDWFELHNAGPEPILLDDYVVADSLTDVGKRVAFPAGTTIEPGAYRQFSMDKDGWPGFALGSDEQLGIWLADGTPVDWVDWDDGQSPGDQSYARVPDVTGDFRTVDTPTPGRPNH